MTHCDWRESVMLSDWETEKVTRSRATKAKNVRLELCEFATWFIYLCDVLSGDAAVSAVADFNFSLTVDAQMFRLIKVTSTLFITVILSLFLAVQAAQFGCEFSLF